MWHCCPLLEARSKSSFQFIHYSSSWWDCKPSKRWFYVSVSAVGHLLCYVLHRFWPTQWNNLVNWENPSLHYLFLVLGLCPCLSRSLSPWLIKLLFMESFSSCHQRSQRVAAQASHAGNHFSFLFISFSSCGNAAQCCRALLFIIRQWDPIIPRWAQRQAGGAKR